MRSRIRRRPISITVSPGPRPPMPPASRDSPASFSVRRGSEYLSCASSTCSLPSRLRARWAKTSRMSCVRSIALSPVASSKARAWAGFRSMSKIATLARRRMASRTISCSLPEPTTVRGWTFERFCRMVPAIVHVRRAHQLQRLREVLVVRHDADHQHALLLGRARGRGDARELLFQGLAWWPGSRSRSRAGERRAAALVQRARRPAAPARLPRKPGESPRSGDRWAYSTSSRQAARAGPRSWRRGRGAAARGR